MEERGQQIAGGRGGGGGSDGEGSEEMDMQSMGMDEPYWGMDEYAYDIEAMTRGRFGRNMRHEASKQARRGSRPGQ